MLNWLKQKLRNWLLADQKGFVPPKEEPVNISDVLECFVTTPDRQQRRVEVRVHGSVGMCLVGQQLGGPLGQQLISEREVVDTNHFWVLWNRFNPGAKLEWVEEGNDDTD